MLLQGAFVDAGHMLDAEDVQRVDRQDIEVLWGEYREIDPKENREAVWRIAMAHSMTPVGNMKSVRHLYGFLTFGFWPEHADKANSFWDHVLQTMIMDRPVADPTKGPQFH